MNEHEYRSRLLDLARKRLPANVWILKGGRCDASTGFFVPDLVVEAMLSERLRQLAIVELKIRGEHSLAQSAYYARLLNIPFHALVVGSRRRRVRWLKTDAKSKLLNVETERVLRKVGQFLEQSNQRIFL